MVLCVCHNGEWSFIVEQKKMHKKKKSIKKTKKKKIIFFLALKPHTKRSFLCY